MSDDSISSAQEFQERVFEDYRSWNTKTYPWFRGEPNKPNTALLPSLYRKEESQNLSPYDENQLVQFFRMKAPALFDSPIKIERAETDKWLFLMQHFRLPTRLLDWTEGALIALFFALSEDNPVVWMLHPCELNRLATGRRYPDNVFPITWGNPASPAVKNIKSAWQHNIPCEQLPIAVHPTSIHIRFSVQRSCFTVHGNIKEGLDKCISKIKPNMLRRILKRYSMNSKCKEKMMQELRILGISNYTLFPDLENLAKDIISSGYSLSEFPIEKDNANENKTTGDESK